ncbi:kinase-like protein [Amniculicola lignicola CBS 123094]|uniref:Kinase-like protein n=1 Tax=Amniculicola lignicola CBS 123094 TaxID=1392246 RepID=A0A6A5W1H1_9PLEO|nr:kinase-like protein [Amniculicola lignicola CBS 123094]
MPFFEGVQSLRLRSLNATTPLFMSMAADSYQGGNGFFSVLKKKMPPHSSHPNFANLTLLVFEAVLEVVCVSLPGYIIARMGMFDAENQKFIANLNTQLFTPFFTKLASQLTADKLVELGVIPFIFVVQTFVSYLAALIVSRIFKFKKRPTNFVTAMAVFGNSNSLPISLVISLSKTLSGLHWDKVPGDNDNEVAARGILYLLIFQQLGQLVRWTWGFNVLLAPASSYKEEDGGKNHAVERGEYSDDEAEALLHDDSDYESGNITPEYRRTYATSTSSSSSGSGDADSLTQREAVPASAEFSTPTNGNVVAKLSNGNSNGRAANGSVSLSKIDPIPKGPRGWPARVSRSIKATRESIASAISRAARRVFSTLPIWLQRTLSKVYSGLSGFLYGLWEFMNPPLWAMLAAIIIASVPALQHVFFDPGSFVSNSVTRAISQSGQVAVPLILVVLGANLARNTLPKEDEHSMEDPAVEKRLVIASLLTRMLIPTIMMAPLLVITAKFVPVSILDDPIFIIVCFLLTGAPSALQLAQICQINGVYMGAMSKILFQSYVRFRSGATMAPTNGLPDAASQSLSADQTHRNTMDESTSPRANATKAVSIAEPEISPLIRGNHKELDQSDSLDLGGAARQFRASISKKRLSGRPSMERLGSKTPSVGGNQSLQSLLLSDDSDLANASPHDRHKHENLLKQVKAWLKTEKARRSARKAKRKASAGATLQPADANEQPPPGDSGEPTELSRRDSDSSEGSIALENLAHILEKTLALKSNEESPRKRRASQGRSLSGILKRHSVVSSDTDYFDGGEDFVPTCEAVLDNSKTMSYTGGGADASDAPTSSAKSTRSTKSSKESDAWATFKFEIVRLTHTLKLKGWRRVSSEQSGDIEVERLSGALTNAVYVVSPPKNIHPRKGDGDTPAHRLPPPKLLLRIYGPQVEHLIDREAELQILRRLARKRIGPRLLGTFTNGRFEEFFHAQTLTPKDLRVPETSKQIAKRMRELHEGIDLLPKERAAGPFVWKNWDKWVNRCEQIVTWLDQQVREQQQSGATLSPDDWKHRGFVCGVEWPVFRKTVEKYRAWLDEQYGGEQKVKERLVFAHNDTQYGNILRLMPAGESPLMLPANEHKQLIVIDFEYANANLPGLEFANHFTEWCYNYHDTETAYACNTKYYPTPEEQHRFICAYLVHNPTHRAQGSLSNPPTPHLGPLPTSGSTTALAATAAPTSISAFMLDSRAPPGEKYTYQEQEALSAQQVEDEAKRLMAETILWRLANSAQWVSWGIVQAHIPGMPDFDGTEGGKTSMEGGGVQMQMQKESQSESERASDNATLEVNAAAEKAGLCAKDDTDANVAKDKEDDEFDYLAYAQERAMFLWGDAIKLGIARVEDLPQEVREMVKVVEY